MKRTVCQKLIGIYNVEGEDDVVLMELQIDISPKEVDASLFTQEDETLPKDSWQVAYDEHFLNEEGTEVIGTFIDQDELNGTTTRIAFFMFNIDFSKPLITQFGQIPLTDPIIMPQRLAKIIQFEPVD